MNIVLQNAVRLPGWRGEISEGELWLVLAYNTAADNATGMMRVTFTDGNAALLLGMHPKSISRSKAELKRRKWLKIVRDSHGRRRLVLIIPLPKSNRSATRRKLRKRNPKVTVAQPKGSASATSPAPPNKESASFSSLSASERGIEAALRGYVEDARVADLAQVAIANSRDADFVGRCIQIARAKNGKVFSKPAYLTTLFVNGIDEANAALNPSNADVNGFARAPVTPEILAAARGEAL